VPDTALIERHPEATGESDTAAIPAAPKPPAPEVDYIEDGEGDPRVMLENRLYLL